MSLFVLADEALQRGEAPTVPHDGSPEVAGDLTWIYSTPVLTWERDVVSDHRTGDYWVVRGLEWWSVHALLTWPHVPLTWRFTMHSTYIQTCRKRS